MHDAFRVDLVQAQQKISRNDLDVTEVESLASLDKVLKQIGWPRWQLDLLLLLDEV